MPPRGSPFQSWPSRPGAFLRRGRGASAPRAEGMSVGGDAGGREASRRDYFPRSFTMSKKQPGRGEDIAGAPRGGGPRDATSSFPAAKTKAKAKAKPGG